MANRDWLINESSAPSALRPQPAAPAPATPLAFDLADITIRRRLGLAEAKEEIQRGEADGIAVFALAGACPICMEAARDMYQPHIANPAPHWLHQPGWVSLPLPSSVAGPAQTPAGSESGHLSKSGHPSPFARRGALRRTRAWRLQNPGPRRISRTLSALPLRRRHRAPCQRTGNLKREARRAREPIGILTQAVPGTSLPLQGYASPAPSNKAGEATPDTESRLQR